ncbi:hypothetical protein PFISCL1PPCAC_1534, partial [Pristionchus fissidentatus]
YPGDSYEDAGMVQKCASYTFFVIVHIILVVLSLVINGTMQAVLIAMRKKLFESTFYIVVAGLMFFTTLKTIIQAVFIVPQYIKETGYHTYISHKRFFIIDTLADYGILIFSTVMAANRCSMFCLSTHCPFFSRVKLILFVHFSFVIIIVAILAGIGCTKEFLPLANAHVDVCPDTAATITFQQLLVSVYYIACAVSCGFYIATYWMIRYQRGVLMKKERNRRGPETVILKQAIIIFGLYLIYIALSKGLPNLVNDSGEIQFLLNYALNFVALLISTAFPGLLLISSMEMRR